MLLVEQFSQICEENRDKPALITKERSVSFGELACDIRKTMDLFEASGLQAGDKGLILVPPSYEFYLLMLAGLSYGLNLVAPDAYNSVAHIRRLLANNEIRHVFCNRKTALLKPFFGGATCVNIARYTRFRGTERAVCRDTSASVLTTFTSGTTGVPKPIERSMEDFVRQIEVIERNVAFDANAVAYSRLPIYVLFILFHGIRCVIDREIDAAHLRRHGVNVVLAPIAQLLRLSEPLPFVKQVAIGGAMVHRREAQTLLSLFPCADVTYVYGSSECVLMAKADLRDYVQTGELRSGLEGVSLRLVDTDSNGVGQIAVSGRVVLTDTNEHISGDLGRLDGDRLTIVGRKACSCEGLYNYELDAALQGENPHVKAGFSLVKNRKIYFCYVGSLSRVRDDVSYVKFRKLPMDAKHKTKLDYKAVLRKIREA